MSKRQSKTAVDMYKLFKKHVDEQIWTLYEKIENLEDKKHDIRMNALSNDTDLDEMRSFGKINKKIKAYNREINRLIELRELDYTNFRNILESFNKKAVKFMLDGESLYMGNQMGSLGIMQVPRNHNNPAIDWGKTNAYKKETGKKKLFYYTDDWWVRWYWNKHKCLAPNKAIYKFKPSRGKVGMVQKLKDKLREDPLAHTKFMKK